MQRAAEEAYREARRPLRTIDLAAEDSADIARAKKAREVARLGRLSGEGGGGCVGRGDGAAGAVGGRAATAGRKLREGGRVSAGRRARASRGGRHYSASASAASDNDDDGDRASVSATPKPPLSLSASPGQSRSASPMPVETLRDRCAAKRRARLARGGETGRRTVTRRTAASVVSWIDDVAAVGEEDNRASSAASGRGAAGEEVKIVDWDDDAGSVVSRETLAAEEGTVFWAQEDEISWLSDDSTEARTENVADMQPPDPMVTPGPGSWTEFLANGGALGPVSGEVIGHAYNPDWNKKSPDFSSTDDEDEAYHAYMVDATSSAETTPTLSYSSLDDDTASISTAISTPTVRHSPKALRKLPSTQSNTDTTPSPPTNLPNNFPPTQNNSDDHPQPEQELSAKARGKLPATRHNAEKYPIDDARGTRGSEKARRRARMLARYRERAEWTW